MRTLTIADEMARRGFATTFLTLPADGDLRDLILSRGHSVVDMARVDDPVPEGIERYGGRAAWILVDHYGLGGAWERMARRVAARVAAIDDLADREHTGDLVVDPNLDATAEKYRHVVRRRTELLLGPRYAPLRPEFAAARNAIGSVSRRVATIVVSMGGSDPDNATALGVAASLLAVPDAQVHVVVGPSFAGRVDVLDPRVHVHRSPQNITSVLVSADLVVGAAGTSALERACLGIPSLVLQLADNQTQVAAALARTGLALDLGRLTDTDSASLARHIRSLADNPARRQTMRDAGMQRVDGMGAIRVANHLDSVRLRRARWADRLLLLAWANDPEARRNSSSIDPIPLDMHLAWLRRTLADRRVDVLIAYNGQGPVGVVRLAPGWRGQLEVSINVAPQHRGGIGTLMLRAALARWQRRLPGRTLVARIKPGNLASERTFARVGFKRVDEAGDSFVYARPLVTSHVAGGTSRKEAIT